jgi:hypothetical protein
MAQDDKKTTDQSNSADKNTPTRGANESVTNTTTVTEQPGQTNQAEKRGEVVIDENKDAHVLKEQSSEERLEDARQEGLRNHEVEHANDEQTNQGDPTSRDKQAE